MHAFDKQNGLKHGDLLVKSVHLRNVDGHRTPSADPPVAATGTCALGVSGLVARRQSVRMQGERGRRPESAATQKGVLRVREPPLPILSASRPEYGRYAALTSTRRIARQRRKGRRQGCPAFGADAYVVVGFETTARRAFPLAQLVLHLVGPSAPVAQITAVAHACSLSELVACAQDRLPRA